MQIITAIGDSDLLPEIGELTFRIERVLTVLKDETGTCSGPKPSSVILQAAANLENWAATSFQLAGLVAQEALNSHEREQVAMLLRLMMQICDRVEATIFDHRMADP